MEDNVQGPTISEDIISGINALRRRVLAIEGNVQRTGIPEDLLARIDALRGRVLTIEDNVQRSVIPEVTPTEVKLLAEEAASTKGEEVCEGRIRDLNGDAFWFSNGKAERG